jgi:divalent metal cation (Fe/Co/Zn/Cd) transporter
MLGLAVIQFSAVDISDGANGKIPKIEVGAVLYAITCTGIVLKFVLWIWCVVLNKIAQSDILEALAEDHFNDVISNSAAIVTVTIAYYTTAWWVDPVGAIGISLVIIYRWIFIIQEQVKKIVGYTAPPDFIRQVSFVLSYYSTFR